MRGISHVRYDGDLSSKARIEAQHDFDLTITRPEDSKFQVMLAQYASAKVGLNLHGAQEAVFLGREWNPAMETQAKDRLRRIGSEFDTIVHIPHCAGSATELIDAIQEDKSRMVEGFDEQVSIAEHMRKWFGKGK
jgi:SNF2 family DNA or RNA helicase